MGPWVVLVLFGLARAEMPLPSYSEATARAAWFEVEPLVADGRYEEAIARATTWERTVRETAGLAHLVGLSYRFLDDAHGAERHLRRATALDDAYSPAWRDLGELYFVQGRHEEARPCFERLAVLVPKGPGSALGPRRLAEIAAAEGDPDAFEGHIREALHRGFSFSEIAGLPSWQRYYADPRMRDAVAKMVTVHGNRRVLDTLVPPATATAAP